MKVVKNHLSTTVWYKNNQVLDEYGNCQSRNAASTDFMQEALESMVGSATFLQPLQSRCITPQNVPISQKKEGGMREVKWSTNGHRVNKWRCCK